MHKIYKKLLYNMYLIFFINKKYITILNKNNNITI